MKRFEVVIILTLMASAGMAKISATVKVTDRSVQVASSRVKSPGTPVDLDTKMKELMADMNDPKISLNEVLNKFLEGSGSKSGRVEDLRRRLENNIDAFNARYSQELLRYIEALARKQGAKKHREGSIMIYALEDGLRFYEEFYKFEGHRDPWFQAVAEAFLSSGFRTLKVADKTEKLAVAVRERTFAETRLFNANDYSEEDLRSLRRIALGKRHKETRFEKVGSVWVFGSGISYLVTTDLLKKGMTSSDPALKAQFERVVRYHTTTGIPVIHHYLQGPVASFNLMEGNINFVLPSQANLGAYSHEITHSRFAKFTKTMDKWVASKKYFMPYQVEGPAKGGSRIGHGGLFNLLDELHSWRLGESFEGPVVDEEILKTLKKSYGNQAGYEATELLEKVWTAEKLRGKSVPYLIYDEIRSFNKKSNEELLLMGLEGVEEKDLVKKMNFLIMHRGGRFKGTPLEADSNFVLEEIAHLSEEPEVRRLLGSVAMTPKKDLSGFDMEKPPKEFSPDDLQNLVERILRSPTTSFNSQGLELLVGVFKELKIQPPIEMETGRSRPSLVGNPFLEALDVALSEGAYEGGVATKKVALMNFIAQSTRPEEMPRTYAKSRDLLLHSEDRPRTDVWLAQTFLYPQGGKQAGSSVLWGERLAQDLMGQKPGASVKEALGVFYKEEVAAALWRGNEDLHGGDFRKGSRRKRIERAFLRLSEEQKHRLETASKNLWILAGDGDPRVRQSALFALISNPMFLIKNQGRLLQALHRKESAYVPVVAFFTEAAPDLIPEATRIFETQKRKRIEPATLGSQVNFCSQIFQ